jgi:hypothetical protein
MQNTILFGNGLNLLTKSNKSWEQLLNELKSPNLFSNGNLPNTMVYERILFEKDLNKNQEVLIEESNIKNKIAFEFSNIANHKIYKDLFDLNVNNYITTNYDYAFSNTISEELNFETKNKSSEDIYSIRRKIEINVSNQLNTNIWHIHGEINKPKTIMLGLDHYCGEIGKIDSYIKGFYTYEKEGKKQKIKSIEEKLMINEFDETSWIDLFFNSDIHIVGFSFHFSEIDLWWILTKRARFIRDSKLTKSIKNKIFFYCDKIDDETKGLFESLGVSVKLFPHNGDYLESYENIINHLKNKIAST